jgi:hypothetical protein
MGAGALRVEAWRWRGVGIIRQLEMRLVYLSRLIESFEGILFDGVEGRTRICERLALKLSSPVLDGGDGEWSALAAPSGYRSQDLVVL